LRKLQEEGQLSLIFPRYFGRLVVG
jgi:hypothetical protein